MYVCACTVYHNRHVSDDVYIHTYINMYTYILIDVYICKYICMCACTVYRN